MSSSDHRERRVLVVEDSAFMRRVITDMIDRFPEYRVVGTATDGEEALKVLVSLDPDVVTLDIEMPRLDGFEVLKRVMSTRPRPIVVLSAHTEEGSREALRALELGAVDFVPKPSGPISFDMGKVEARLHQALQAASSADLSAIAGRAGTRAPERVAGPALASEAAIAIAASTGGPRALARLLSALPERLGAGVLVVQHMPPGFTTTLAARLDELSPWPVAEARGGESVLPDHAWVAPGDFHMRVRRVSGRVRIALDQREPLCGSRPSADALFPSVAETFGHRCVGVVLTGMGRDGAAGLAAIRDAGGHTLAQDRKTSVVFGMPGQAIARGAAERALPLDELAGAIVDCLESIDRSGVRR